MITASGTREFIHLSRWERGPASDAETLKLNFKVI
jgi:hypothetical protein